MRKFYRSILLTGAVMALVAGCGDDVTISQPITVSVGPEGASISVGGTQQMSAAVNAPSGVPTTVTWSSSNAAVASVSATGLVTGVSAGAVAIQACSTENTSACGQATVTVTANVPPQVTIQSITNTVIGTGEVPVNINAVAGQINVAINFEPGTTPATRVELLIGDSVVASQSFSALEWAGLVANSVEQGGELADVVIILSVNTAAFNATTGAVAFQNGPRQLSARAVLAGGSQVATPSTQLVFANANTFVQSNEFTGTTASATGTAGAATGLAFRRGGLTVSILPVIYNAGQTLAVGSSITFGSACDASGTGARTRALVAPAAGSNAWTAAFPQAIPAGGAAVNTVNNYEFSPGAAFGLTTCGLAFPGGEVAALTAVDNNGNNILFAAPPAVGAGIRVDNRAPGAPTFVANPNLRQNGWINGAVAIGNNTSATSNNWLANGAADAGIGGGVISATSYLRFIRVAAPTATGTVANANAAEAASTFTTPAPTAANNSLCAVISARDELGNESALPGNATACSAPPVPSSTAVAAQHLRFGVDIAPPTIAFCPSTGAPAPCGANGLAVNAQLNGGTVGNEFRVSVADTGLIGNSGMLSTAAVRGTVQLRAQGLTPPSAASCYLGAFASGACNIVSVNLAPAFPEVATANPAVAGNATTAYYTYSAFAQDAAGNQSDPVTRVIAFDPAANVPALTQALFNVPLSGGTAVFNANASDNFDLQSVQYSLTYAGAGLAGPILYPAVTLNTFNTEPLVNSNVSAGITITGFMRQVEVVTGNGPLTTGGGFKPTGLTGIATDMALNPSAAAVTGIPGASVTNGVLFTAAAAPKLTNSWAITAPAAATNISDGAGPAAAVNPLSVTYTATACGPTATFDPPFSVVDFYIVFGGNLVQIGTGTQGTTVDDGSAFGRCTPWSFTWTPGTTFGGPGLKTVHAIGVSAAGDGLASLANANVTVTNP